MISYIQPRSPSKRVALLAFFAGWLAGSTLGLAVEPEATPPAKQKTYEWTAIDVDRDKFGEGWDQTLTLEPSGETYEVWVKDGWLAAKHCDKGGAIDWQIVLAKIVGTEVPSISRYGSDVPASGDDFELTYQGGRYFIRDSADTLRAVRELKTGAGFFPRPQVLGENAEDMATARRERKIWRTLKAWKQVDWCVLTSGPDDQRYDVFVRLNPIANGENGYGVSTRASGLLHFFHGETWFLDDGDFLVVQRTLKASYDAEQARKRIASSLPGSAPPRIDASAWLNTKDDLSWEKLQGKVVLLDFWATWCGPCIDKLPKVQALANKYAPRDLVVIGIHAQREGETCQDFVTKHGITFPIAIDSGKTAESFAVDSIPSLFLIDKSGKVVSGYANDLPTDETIQRLLAE